jgi:prefoldin subunit 5
MAKKSLTQQIQTAQTELLKLDEQMKALREQQKITKELIANLKLQQEAELGRQVMVNLGVETVAEAMPVLEQMNFDQIKTIEEKGENHYGA